MKHEQVREEDENKPTRLEFEGKNNATIELTERASFTKSDVGLIKDFFANRGA